VPLRSDISSARARWIALLLSVVLVAFLERALAVETTVAQTNAPTEASIAAALAELKADPNLASERSMRTLRWLDSNKPRAVRSTGWLAWLGELMQWIATGGRVIVWLAVAVLAALLALLIARLIRTISPRAVVRQFEAPTHVRDLDIRPESLPEDIGAAALQLWREDKHRASLSLLYRGLLSRLVHVHGLPIRHSTTEGDCMELAAKHFAAERSSYVAQLVRVWQLAVYGGHEPRMDDVQNLCNGFASALAKPGAPS
jgi:hypothetical protein